MQEPKSLLRNPFESISPESAHQVGWGVHDLQGSTRQDQAKGVLCH